MQLYTTTNKSIYRLYFNELETNNITKALDGNIGISNIRLCYFIEETLPKLFKECSNKRVMVTKIHNSDKYITAVILLQNIELKFNKPKDENCMFKVTEVSFKDGKSFKDWILGKKYAYKIKSVSNRRINVLIYNMSYQDEMLISQNNGEIQVTCNVMQYIIIQAAKKIKKAKRSYTM